MHDRAWLHDKMGLQLKALMACAQQRCRVVIAAPCFFLLLPSFSLLPNSETINRLISAILTKALLSNRPTKRPSDRRTKKGKIRNLLSCTEELDWQKNSKGRIWLLTSNQFQRLGYDSRCRDTHASIDRDIIWWNCCLDESDWVSSLRVRIVVLME